jgi:CRISPR-associated endonuclease/helicase Cas3
LSLPFGVVQMSATAHERHELTFELGDADRAHPLLRKRLEGSKPAQLREARNSTFVQECVKATLESKPGPGEVHAVVVNRVQTAREVALALTGKALPATEVHLVTGRMRGWDRDALGEVLQGIASSGRSRSDSTQAHIVVATQCIEAGADYDFDRLVTEAASLDALKQRFGRLDRVGRLGHAPATIILRTESLKADPVYGEGLPNTWNWLQAQVQLSGDGTVDFGIQRLPTPDESAGPYNAPRESAPVLLPAHLDAWAQTSPQPAVSPDIALWLHGPERGQPDVQIVWRADITEELLQLAIGADRALAEAARRYLADVVAAVPPVSSEALSVSYAAAVAWLTAQPERPLYDVEGASNDEVEPDRDAPRGRPVYRWRHDRSGVALPSRGRRGSRDGEENTDVIRPGDTIVVPSSYGGLHQGTWSPQSAERVSDIGDLASYVQRGRAALRLHRSVLLDTIPALPESLYNAPWPPTPGSEEVVSAKAVLKEWFTELTQLMGAAASDGAQATKASAASDVVPKARRVAGELVASFQKGLRKASVEVIAPSYGLHPATSFPSYTAVTAAKSSRTQSPARSEFMEGGGSSDDSNNLGQAVRLEVHLQDVAAQADWMAERVGLERGAASAVRVAALWHDVGKVDPRFQAWLRGSAFDADVHADEPLAKSASASLSRTERESRRLRAAYPRGARHELASVALIRLVVSELIEQGDVELMLHLVASHHGFCRPFAPWSPDESPVTLQSVIHGRQLTCSSAHGLESLDSGVADTYWALTRRYGWWGLAWLEALFRLADHRASALEQTAASEAK